MQSGYDYEEDSNMLFEEDVTAEVIARDVRGIPPKTKVAPAPAPAPVVVPPSSLSWSK